MYEQGVEEGLSEKSETQPLGVFPLKMNARDSAKVEEELRSSPLTLLLTMVFTLVCGLGLIYVFAFSDNAQDRWRHFYVVFASAAFSGTLLAFAKRAEDRGRLALRWRRRIWAIVLCSYVAVAASILLIGSSPFGRFTETLRLLCCLGGLSPVAFIAWRLLRSNEKANRWDKSDFQDLAWMRRSRPKDK